MDQEEKEVLVVVVEEESDFAREIDPGLHNEKIENSIWATRIWSFLTHYSSLWSGRKDANTPVTETEAASFPRDPRLLTTRTPGDGGPLRSRSLHARCA